MAETDKCNILHEHAGCRCIRQKGHGGLCWSKAVLNREDGSITRCEWYSANGQFKRHHHYATQYPDNAQRMGDSDV